MDYIQGQSTKGIPFKMLSALDGFTPTPNLVVTVQLSKAGGSFQNASGTVSDLGGGSYYLNPNASDYNTVGSLVLMATALNAVNTIVDDNEVISTTTVKTYLPLCNKSTLANKFSVGDLVYLVTSANLGYLASYKITQVAQQPNLGWYYRVSIPPRPPTAINTMGDRITNKHAFDIGFAENELTDVCTACTIAITALQAKITNLQNIRSSLCTVGSN